MKMLPKPYRNNKVMYMEGFFHSSHILSINDAQIHWSNF